MTDQRPRLSLNEVKADEVARAYGLGLDEGRADERERADTIAREALAAMPDRDAILPNEDAGLRTIVDNQLHEVAARLWSLTLPRATDAETPATPREAATEPHSAMWVSIAETLADSLSLCAHCQVCDRQTDAVMGVIRQLQDAWEIQRSMAKLRHKQATTAQTRAEAAEAKLAEVRADALILTDLTMDRHSADEIGAAADRIAGQQ